MKSLKKIFEYRKISSNNLGVGFRKARQIIESFVLGISPNLPADEYVYSYDQEKGIVIITTPNKTLANEMLLQKSGLVVRLREENLFFTKLIVH